MSISIITRQILLLQGDVLHTNVSWQILIQIITQIQTQIQIITQIQMFLSRCFTENVSERILWSPRVGVNRCYANF